MKLPAYRAWPGGLVFGVALLVMAACSSPSAPGSSDGSPQPGQPEYSGFLAASEFVVGNNRFPFGLLSMDGQLLESAQVQVRFYLLAQETNELKVQAPARFRQVEGVTPHRHDDGQVHEHVEVRGVYVVDRVNFDQPGFWGAEFLAATAGGPRLEVQGAAFEVKAESPVPAIGDPAPPSRNLTLADVDSIEEIETRSPPDDMHQLSVMQALEEGRPFVVVFATPMFCVTRMCGPVTDVAAALQERYQDRVNFIHIEPWDLAVARGQGKLVPIDIMLEWNLPTEPWVFVVDEKGLITARFEGLVSSDELEAALQALQ